MKVFLFLLITIFSHLAHAESFWDMHSEGWHWYHDPRMEKEQEADPIKTMSSIQTQTKRALDNAILHPTPENIKTYITLQNRIAAKASLFSEVWQRTLWSHPELDYSLTHPTNQIAKQTYFDKERLNMNAAMSTLSKTEGLFFFFKGSCSYCHQMSPLVKTFAEQFGFSLIAISLDGGVLPEFPDAKINQVVAAQLNVTAVPALFMVNPTTHRITSIASGLISTEELMQRVYSLTQTNDKREM